jgi:glucokinase
MVGIFIGTGIGGGIIIDGKLYSGFSGTAAEIGHMVIQVGGPKCNCGNRGCFEALASRTAIFRAIHAAIKDGQKPS